MCLPFYRAKWVTLHRDMARPPVAGGGKDIRIYKTSSNMFNKGMRRVGQQRTSAFGFEHEVNKTLPSESGTLLNVMSGLEI
jgi:hypothetical protein